MFQFTGFPSIHYGFMYGYMRFAHVGFPIQISPDQCVFAAPRRFSQLVASFFATESLGILRVPFSPFRCLFRLNAPLRGRPWVDFLFTSASLGSGALGRLHRLRGLRRAASALL